MKRFLNIGIGLLFIFGVSANAENGPSLLVDMSLEQLLNIPIKTRHFTEQLNSAPRPLSVYTESTLHRNLVHSSYDLSLLVPNFSLHRNFGRYQERPVIRGVASIVGESPAGILIDGVSVSNIAQSIPMQGLEQIEVLRGPEAALYGRANFSGAINFVYKRPVQNNYAVVNSKLANNQYRTLDFEGNIAPTNTTALLLTAVKQSNANSIDNNLGDTTRGYGAELTQMLSLAGTWQPSEHLAFYYRATKQDDNDGHIPAYLQNREFNNCYLDTSIQYYCGELPAPKAVGYNSAGAPWDLSLENTIERQHLEASVTQNKFDITFTHARSSLNNATGFDGDLYELQRVYTQLNKHSADTTSQVISNIYFDTGRLLIGASHYSLDKFNQTNNAFDFGGPISVMAGAAQSVYVDNTSLFASVDKELGNDIKLSVDVRYSKDEIAYSSIDDGETYSDANVWHSVSPRVNVSKLFNVAPLNNQWLAYISMAKGRKPGGFNDNLEPLAFENDTERARVLGFKTFEEETLISYDIGLKGELIANKVFFSTNIFYYDWQHLQLTQSLSYVNDSAQNVRVTTIANGGKSHNMGAELELEAALTSAFSTRLNMGVTQTELKNTATTAHLDLTGNGDVSGNHIPNAPQLDVYVGLYYQRALASNLHLSLSNTLAYESKRYVAEHNFATIGDFYRLNLMASIERDNWVVSLWGKNLNNDTTPESAARFGDAATFFQTRAFGISLAEERQVGLGVSLSFH